MNATELRQEVEELLKEVDKTHRYSMTRIYDLSNKVFDKSEKPQSCASCLIRKVRELKNWLGNETEQKIESKGISPKPKRRYKNKKAE